MVLRVECENWQFRMKCKLWNLNKRNYNLCFELNNLFNSLLVSFSLKQTYKTRLKFGFTKSNLKKDKIQFTRINWENRVGINDVFYLTEICK